MTRRIQVRRTTATGLAALLGAVGLTVGGFAAAGLPASAAPALPAASGSSTAGPTDPSGPTGTSTSCPPGPTGIATAAPGAVVQTWDFEDGTTQGWSGTNHATVDVTTDAAASGTYGLAAHTLYSGNEVSVTTGPLPSDSWYSVTAKIRVGAGGGFSTSIGLKAKNVAASIPGRASVSSSGWTTVTTWFRPNTLHADGSCNGTMTGTSYPAPATFELTVDYPPCSTPPPIILSTLYVDDVTVTSSPYGTALPPGVTPFLTTWICGTTPPPATCQASYKIITQWGGGYVASVDVRNLTTTAKPTWTLRWTFPDDETVNTLWGGTVTQSGRTVTVTAPSWAPIPAGGTVTVGFLGSATAGTPTPPTGITLDGAACGALT